MNHQRYLEGKKDEADHPFGTSLSRWDSFAAGHRGALSDKTYVGFSPDAKPCNIGHAKAGTSLDWERPQPVRRTLDESIYDPVGNHRPSGKVGGCT